MSAPMIRFLCRGARDPEADATIAALLADDLKEAAAAVDAAARTPCGADLTAAIDALPLDGAEHVVPCPSCGLEVRVQRPPAAAEEEPAPDPAE